MNLITDAIAWLLAAEHWSGADGIPQRVFEHLQLSIASVLVGALIALPIGIVIGHTRRGTLAAVTIANVGRAIPSFALLVMVLPFILSLRLGLGFWPTFVPLVLLAIPPILTNTYVGIRQVDADIVEAARGMGMRGTEVARRVELPLALPLIFTGVGVATVQVIATATLGAIVAGGGLGRYIVDGLALQEYDRVVVGAFLVALLAILAELAIRGLERQVTSPGLAKQDGRFGTGVAARPAT